MHHHPHRPHPHPHPHHPHDLAVRIAFPLSSFRPPPRSGALEPWWLTEPQCDPFQVTTGSPKLCCMPTHAHTSVPLSFLKQFTFDHTSGRVPTIEHRDPNTFLLETRRPSFCFFWGRHVELKKIDVVTCGILPSRGRMHKCQVGCRSYNLWILRFSFAGHFATLLHWRSTGWSLALIQSSGPKQLCCSPCLWKAGNGEMLGSL